MLAKTERKPFSGAILYPTPEAMFEAMFGPPQHDAHVKERERIVALKAAQQWADAADARVDAATQAIIARIRSAK